YNKIANLSVEQKQQGVIPASAGNQAQGEARSALKFRIKAVLVMPESTPLLKVSATKCLGAEVMLRGYNFDEDYAFATSYAFENNLIFIHP
ncbi:pyridoxal-phosphate dependent enzyme, partial [Campylobacter jejuni]|uniref:pyridoxal-phosphate dependent enzyme n=1 Tax=Campylobacter jejuni TaxID=197 RepID=UPI001F099F49